MRVNIIHYSSPGGENKNIYRYTLSLYCAPLSLATISFRDRIRAGRTSMIKDFNRDEKKALIAVAKFIASHDAKLNEGELEKFDQLSSQEGFGDFHELFAEVDKEITSLVGLSHAINKVTNRAIQEEITEFAVTMARADGFTSPGEHDTIQYLCRVWNIVLKNSET